MSLSRPTCRRRFLGTTTGLAAVSLSAGMAPARARPADTRALTLAHLHTGERLDIVYATQSRYLPPALQALNHFLRDHYSGEVGRMDPALFDLLHRVEAVLGRPGGFEIVSGFRGEATNEHLRLTRGGGVARRSLHMDGQAVDVRLPGVALADLRDAAWSLQAGGVGYYPNEGFVHLDTGRLRRW